MAKNGLIDTKFDHILYLWDFYEFSIFQTSGNFDKWLPNVLDNLPRGSNLGIESEHKSNGKT